MAKAKKKMEEQDEDREKKEKEQVNGERGLRYKGKHDKPKPWDTPDIDHWKVEPFQPAWNAGGMLEESSFCTLFPKYREKYLQEVWPAVTKALKEHGIDCKLNLVEGSMTVSTTRKTQDPYIIMKSRDLIKLLSRSVPAPQGLRILDDNMQCDIIKIGSLERNKPTFVKRRQRLLGANGETLKTIELLTGCYLHIQGNTVAAMGTFKGLKLVRRIVEDCITNALHPIYHIKVLMVRRELEKDPLLANQNWDRFLPQFKKKNVKRKKADKKEKKPYTPFPPPQQPSKVDLQLESGEYFLSAEKKAAKKWQEKKDKQAEKAVENKRKRDAEFIPPREPKLLRKEEHISVREPGKMSTMDANNVALKLKEKVKGMKQGGTKPGIKSYLAVPDGIKR